MACCHCGGVIGFDYRNKKTISNLKRKTKDWRYCDGEGNLCPECYEKWSKKVNEIEQETRTGNYYCG